MSTEDRHLLGLAAPKKPFEKIRQLVSRRANRIEGEIVGFSTVGDVMTAEELARFSILAKRARAAGLIEAYTVDQDGAQIGELIPVKMGFARTGDKEIIKEIGGQIAWVGFKAFVARKQYPEHAEENKPELDPVIERAIDEAIKRRKKGRRYFGKSQLESAKEVAGSNDGPHPLDRIITETTSEDEKVWLSKIRRTSSLLRAGKVTGETSSFGIERAEEADVIWFSEEGLRYRVTSRKFTEETLVSGYPVSKERSRFL